MPGSGQAATDINSSLASDTAALVPPTQDFDNFTISELKSLLADAGVVCDKVFKKKADYIAALQALPATAFQSTPAEAPSTSQAAASFPRTVTCTRGPSSPSEDDVEVHAIVGGRVPVQRTIGSGVRDFVDVDGSDDDDGPQCLADILPTTQRSKLNAESHNAAMVIVTADVQLLFASMARDTLKKGTVGRKSKGHLDVETQRIMGQANIEFAMGNFEKSKELCLRVVQLQPHSTQPYSTLSSIYESIGDIRRATDYLLCAAVVKPRDAEIWMQLATKFQSLGQLKSAIHCLKRASSNRRGDLNILWTRFELQSQLHVDGNYRLSLDTLETIQRRGLAVSSDLPLDPLVQSATMRLAFEHHKNGKLESAANILRNYVNATEARGVADYDACNLLAECMAMLQQWHAMFEFLCSLQSKRSVLAQIPFSPKLLHSHVLGSYVLTAAPIACLLSCSCI